MKRRGVAHGSDGEETLLAVTLSSLLAVGCGGGPSSTTGDSACSGGEPKAGSITVGNYQSVLNAGFGGLGGVTESRDALSESGESTDDIFDISACETGSVTPTQTLIPPSRSAVFVDCVVGESKFNGSVSFVANPISGGFLLDPPVGNGSVTATITLDHFSAKTSDIDINDMHGAMTLKITVAGANETTEITSDGLSFNFTEDGTTQAIETTSMAFKFIENGGNGEETDTLDYSYKQVLDGKDVTITYDTTMPFITAENEDYPRSGSMTIKSSEGGTIRITAKDDERDKARLEVDVDDDGDNEINAGKQPWSTISGETGSGSS